MVGCIAIGILVIIVVGFVMALHHGESAEHYDFVTTIIEDMKENPIKWNGGNGLYTRKIAGNPDVVISLNSYSVKFISPNDFEVGSVNAARIRKAINKLGTDRTLIVLGKYDKNKVEEKKPKVSIWDRFNFSDKKLDKK